MLLVEIRGFLKLFTHLFHDLDPFAPLFFIDALRCGDRCFVGLVLLLVAPLRLLIRADRVLVRLARLFVQPLRLTVLARGHPSDPSNRPTVVTQQPLVAAAHGLHPPGRNGGTTTVKHRRVLGTHSLVLLLLVFAERRTDHLVVLAQGMFVGNTGAGVLLEEGRITRSAVCGIETDGEVLVLGPGFLPGRV